MRERDSLHRFIIENSKVRGELVHLDATWQAIVERSDYPPVVKRQLGDALAAIALLAATIKFKGALILQIRGDGPLHMLVVQATHENTLRGIARWHDDVPDGSLQDIFGNANIVITIEPEFGDPYQGIIALQGDNLAAAIEAYFMQSEQLPTRLWLASDDHACAGFLLQELPGKQNDPHDWEHHEHLAATLTAEEILSLQAKDLLHRLFHEEDVRLFESDPLSFRCTCSRERIEAVLLSLGPVEVHDIIEKEGNVSVDCEFCNAHYEFDTVDVEAIFAASNQPEGPGTIQ